MGTEIEVVLLARIQNRTHTEIMRVIVVKMIEYASEASVKEVLRVMKADRVSKFLNISVVREV